MGRIELNDVEWREWVEASRSLEAWVKEIRARLALVGWWRDKQSLAELRRLALYSRSRLTQLLGVLVPGQRVGRGAPRVSVPRYAPPDLPGQVVLPGCDEEGGR